MADHDLENPASLKAHFPFFGHHSELAYWDSAASTQLPRATIAALNLYFERQHSNIHRGQYHLAEENTARIESIRAKVRAFLGAPDSWPVVFNSGATAGLNQLAYGLRPLLKKDAVIVVTADAHHANFVPWQMAAQAGGAELVEIPVDRSGQLDAAAWAAALEQKPTVVALTHVSNVTGRIQPIKALAAEARRAGAYVIVDGAQAVAHLPLNLTDLGVDAYVFSAHKLYAPTGVGVLTGTPELLDKLDPFTTGGGMIASVSAEKTTWATLPDRLEAGTLNLSGIVGLGATIDWLNTLNWPAPLEHEQEMIAQTAARLREIPGLTLVGPEEPEKRVGVFAFAVEDLHPHDLAEVMGSQEVAVRAGHHCAMPLHVSWQLPATVRASLGLYTTPADIDRLEGSIREAIKTLSRGR